MNPLELRRRLLVAESELNRSQIIVDCAEVAAGVRLFTERAKSFGSLLSSAQILITATAAFQQGRSSACAGPSSWLQTMIKGAGLISTVWFALKRLRKDKTDKGSLAAPSP